MEATNTSEGLSAGEITRLHDLIEELKSRDKALSAQAAMQLKDCVLNSNPLQRCFQDTIAEMPGAIDALVHLIAHGDDRGKYYSCFALAQLAWSHPINSYLIAIAKNWLQNLETLFQGRVNSVAKEYAAIMVGNCVANSVEAAVGVARRKPLLAHITKLLSSEASSNRLQETATLALKNCAASCEEAAFHLTLNDSVLSVILSRASPYARYGSDSNFVPRNLELQQWKCCTPSQILNLALDPLFTPSERGLSIRLRDLAVGTINSMSRSARAARLLSARRTVEDVLEPMLYEKARHSEGEGDLIMLTVTCALVNIASVSHTSDALTKFLKTKTGKDSIENMVNCLGYAMTDKRWHNVSFSPHSVLFPLRNLALCGPQLLHMIAELGVLPHLENLLQNFSEYSQSVTSLRLGTELLAMLSAEQSLQQVLRSHNIICSMRNIKQRAENVCEDAEDWNEIAIRSTTTIDLLAEPLVAVLMGFHTRLGQSSHLLALDEAVLFQILVFAFFDCAGARAF